MKKILIFFILLLTYYHPGSAAPATGGIDIFQGGINNPTGWTQPTRSYKYTVGADGVSLYHNRQKLPITLKTPATPGTVRSVTDYAIAPRTTNTGAGNTNNRTPGAGNTNTQTPGAGNTNTQNTGTGNTNTQNPGAGNTNNRTPGAGNTNTQTPGAGNTNNRTPGAGNTNTQNTGTGNTNNQNTTTTAKAGWKSASTLQKAGAVVGGALGAYGIYENTTGQGEHTATNVAGGTVSGLLGGVSIGALWGAKAGWIGAALGAAAGGLITGSQLFSETDCLTDPVTGKFTCCNTLFNQGERQAAIGEYMFCGTLQPDGTTKAMAPGVRQCLQGGSKTELSWWDGLWEDDTWNPGECIVRYCSQEPPANTLVTYTPDTEKYCWNWEPASDSENAYITTNDGSIVAPSDPYSVLIYKLEQEIKAYQNQCDTQ